MTEEELLNAQEHIMKVLQNLYVLYLDCTTKEVAEKEVMQVATQAIRETLAWIETYQ